MNTSLPKGGSAFPSDPPCPSWTVPPGPSVEGTVGIAHGWRGPKCRAGDWRKDQIVLKQMRVRKMRASECVIHFHEVLKTPARQRISAIARASPYVWEKSPVPFVFGSRPPCVSLAYSEAIQRTRPHRYVVGGMIDGKQADTVGQQNHDAEARVLKCRTDTPPLCASPTSGGRGRRGGAKYKPKRNKSRWILSMFSILDLPGAGDVL